MVAVLVILDGASEPLRGAPTSLELARTPALARLARQEELTRLRTIAAGLVAGSEAAIPALLVPCVAWSPAGDTGAETPGRRLTERAVAHLPIIELPSAAALAVA